MNNNKLEPIGGSSVERLKLLRLSKGEKYREKRKKRNPVSKDRLMNYDEEKNSFKAFLESYQRISKEWIFTMDEIEWGEKLGSGGFGRTYKAILWGQQVTQTTPSFFFFLF